MDTLFIPGWLITVVIVAILVLILLVKGYVNAKPNEVVVITGLRKQRHLRGKAGFMIPFVEQRSYLDIEQFSTDVRTSEAVPTLDFINVRADAAVKLKIGTTDEMIARAAENFLNWNTTDISNSVQDVLEGNLREVIGQMELRKMVNDRQEFASKVQDNVAPDLGLEVIAFTVQSFSDEGGVIDNLGIENVETIKKDALIAKAKAERERKEVEAEQDKLANDKRVAADLEIAQKQNELKLKQAALKQEADIAQAKADAAKGIEAEVQRREQERVAAEANIMKQEKEAEVKEREVKVREQELDANIRKQAEAEKYARQQAAEAELIERQRKAEAELFETQKEAEARKAQAEAEKFAQLQEAEAIEAKGRAEAEAIRLKLEAEAKGLDQKAEAMKKMQEAAITEMVVDKLPEIARAVAEPLTKVDKITMYGEGNASKMVGDIMQSIDQVSQGAGFDIRQLLAGALGVNMTVNKLKEGEQPVIEAEELASKED
jgi:flotillin